MAWGADCEREAGLRPEPVVLPAPRRGEIWSVLLPGQPDDPHQPRPALVVSHDVRNRLSDDVIVAPIFSHGASGPTHVPIGKGVGGINRGSVVFCEELTTIDRAFLTRGPWGSPVEAAVMAAVVRAIRRAVGDAVPEPA